MRRKIVGTIIILIVLVAGGLILGGVFSGSSQANYQFTTLTRGDLESTISASGVLSPLTTVDVGTQVSGTIDTVYVDYNDDVKEGQVLAVLDTILLKTSVVEAEASLEKAEAAMEQAQADYDRNKSLFERDMISESDFLPYKISLKSQNASLKSAQAAVLKANQNLQYAVITSPINGTVISKDVEAGQTVAASFSTPTLFQIAEDLSHMQILVDVDESDIGSIKEGQQVRFEVQAYSDEEFDGMVRQVRMQPTTVSNVVTYTVVVDAENKDNLLLPGMTATVDFIISQQSDVLLVSNKALRFQPSEDELARIRERMQKQFENMPDSLKQARRNPPQGSEMSSDSTTVQGQSAMSAGSNTAKMSMKDMSQIWYIDDEGQLAMEPVRTGMTDGTNTEIVMSRNLKEGMQVISSSGGTQSTTKSSQSNRPGGFGGPPPGF